MCCFFFPCHNKKNNQMHIESKKKKILFSESELLLWSLDVWERRLKHYYSVKHQWNIWRLCGWKRKSNVPTDFNAKPTQFSNFIAQYVVALFPMPVPVLEPHLRSVKKKNSVMPLWAQHPKPSPEAKQHMCVRGWQRELRTRHASNASQF